MITPKRFELEDKLYQLGFSAGLPLRARQSQIAKFIGTWSEDFARLESWLNYLEENNEIQNKGAYIRKVMAMNIAPPKAEHK